MYTSLLGKPFLLNRNFYNTNANLPFKMTLLCITLQADPYMRCTHLRNEDRSFTGTLVTIKLFAALDRGYKLLDVYEVWHFSETAQYDKASGEGGIFAVYIDTFLRIKQESSGYPDLNLNAYNTSASLPFKTTLLCFSFLARLFTHSYNAKMNHATKKTCGVRKHQFTNV